ncbi:hypothetical protein HIM_03265 [Hirsutella minnesotensis 3608]|nr:hypothetical protein HIM_03265 [Hirsutella minnesotensis 3608]
MPPAKKTSVFIGREIMVDRDEVESIRPSIEPEAEHRSEFRPLSWDENVNFEQEGSFDEARESPKVSWEQMKQGVNNRREKPEEEQSQEEALQPLPAKRSRGRPRRTEQMGSLIKALKPPAHPHRRSSRIKTAAAPPVSKPAPRPSQKPRGRPGRKPKVAATRSGTGAGKEWEIERIVDSRIDAATLEQHFYLVKWKGWAEKHNTWEPKKNLANCSAAIVAYEKAA